jgi:hypothetical protein
VCKFKTVQTIATKVLQFPHPCFALVCKNQLFGYA